MNKRVEYPEPKNLDITGRSLRGEEFDNLAEHFDGMNYMTETMSVVGIHIADAKDIESASAWVQWCINAALGSFDEIMERMDENEELEQAAN